MGRRFSHTPGYAGWGRGCRHTRVCLGEGRSGAVPARRPAWLCLWLWVTLRNGLPQGCDRAESDGQSQTATGLPPPQGPSVPHYGDGGGSGIPLWKRI